MTNAPTAFGVAQVTARLVVYPNPATGHVYVRHLDATQTYLYDIYSTLGQRVGAGLISGTQALDVGRLSPGTYVLLLRVQERAYSAQGTLLVTQLVVE